MLGKVISILQKMVAETMSKMPTMNGDHDSKPIDTTQIDLFDGWAARAPSRIAAEFNGQTITYGQLRNASLHVSRALLSAGVKPCDRVPLLTDMSLAMFPAVIGILRIGACFAPMDVQAWSLSRIEGALLGLSSPVALVTSPCPGLQLPTITVNFQKEWLHLPLDDTDELFAVLDTLRQGLRTDHLAYIIHTSGTTGKPKGVMIPHRGAQALLNGFPNKDTIPPDVEGRGVRCLLAASVAFDGCQLTMWSALVVGRILVMALPSNFHEVAATCDVMGLTPSMLAALDPAGPYDSVRTIVLGAEAPSREVYRQWITPTRRVMNTYGPSEATCIISMGDLSPDGDPTFGNLMLGAKVVLVDEELQETDQGEVMIAGPSLAAGYLNNSELTAEKFIQWNGERYYRTGDLARRRSDGQYVFMGRADSLVKNRGFLINLETEVEPALLSFDSVRVAVAFKGQNQRLVGCVQPATVNVEQLRLFLRDNYDPFVVPDDLVALDSFPLNVNGKTDRNAIKAQLALSISQEEEEDLLQSLGPDSDVYDALRVGFAQTLHVAFKQLDRESSFITLGGHSLTAIRLSNFLGQHKHSLSVAQILRLDSIGRLEEDIKKKGTVAMHEHISHESDGPAPATDLWKVLIQRSLENPEMCALIGITEYIGDASTTPTASEMHDAIIKACSAHSIFYTRFNLSDFSLSDLDYLNVDWKEISVPSEADFEAACEACEKQAWLDLKEVTRAQIEAPYSHVTCLTVPGRKALALVTRTHHILTDVYTSSLLAQDVQRALAGEEVPQGPKIQDYARFMDAYKRDNLDKVYKAFEKMLKDLPATAVLQPPSPTHGPEEGHREIGLVRFDSPTTMSKAALDAAARSHRVTTTTLVYAAWALFLHSFTAWDRVGFTINISGRTIPWAGAESVLGCLVGRGIFSTAVRPQATVHEWLAEVHQTTLDLLEFDGLTSALPASLSTADPRTNKANIVCLLDMPSSSPDWTYRERNGHGYILNWILAPDGKGGVVTEFEVQSRSVDLDWAKELASRPGRLLDGLAKATHESLVGSLLDS
jgi:non-ribosomal peptide synthetase component F